MSAISQRGHNIYRAELKQIVDELIQLGDDYGRLRSAAGRLHALLIGLARWDPNSESPFDRQETFTATGKAISPIDAARCILDFQRTAKFTRGVHAAINQALKRFKQRPIEILYAGCGPFAPFAVAMVDQFPINDVRFTLLDIHKKSLDTAARILQLLSCAELVREYVECDAALYRHPGRQFHLAVTETMQMALEKEPHVAIALNLLPQLVEGGILIPEKIAVDVCLATMQEASDSDCSENRVKIDLGRILEISASTLAKLGQRGSNQFPPVTIRIPEEVGVGLHLMLATSIQVFDSIRLGDYDSGITFPKFLMDLAPPQRNAQIEFTYRIDQAPGFKYCLVGQQR